MKKPSDYFAELYVAGRFAEAGWNVYFPHRDKGFDFIVSKPVFGSQMIRPVQVKGKYPTEGKSDKNVYGFSGTLSQVHPDMVLAIPYFDSTAREMPLFIAYLPWRLIRPSTKSRHRSVPATFKDGKPQRRRDFARFFDDKGIGLIELPGWNEFEPEKPKC